MKVLLIGAKGQLGRCLSEILANTNYEIMLASRSDIDLLDFNSMEKQILEFRPNIIINAAAYTNVDMAEVESDLANLINNQAVLKLSQICKSIDSSLIHFSTDYVFNGKSDIPYAEDDQTNPLGNYGKTKRLGELAIQNTIDKHIIIRTSWVFSEYGNNFLKTMLRLSETSSNLRIVGDQHGCPTYAHDIAKAVIKIIAKIESGFQEWGIFNFSGDSKTSWHGFANKIFDERLLIDSNYPNPSLTKITSNEFETKAERPMFSTLNNTKIFNSFDITPSDWRNGIKNVLNKIYLDVKK